MKWVRTAPHVYVMFSGEPIPATSGNETLIGVKAVETGNYDLSRYSSRIKGTQNIIEL